MNETLTWKDSRVAFDGIGSSKELQPQCGEQSTATSQSAGSSSRACARSLPKPISVPTNTPGDRVVTAVWNSLPPLSHLPVSMKSGEGATVTSYLLVCLYQSEEEGTRLLHPLCDLDATALSLYLMLTSIC